MDGRADQRIDGPQRHRRRRWPTRPDSGQPQVYGNSPSASGRRSGLDLRRRERQTRRDRHRCAGNVSKGGRCFVIHRCDNTRLGRTHQSRLSTHDYLPLFPQIRARAIQLSNLRSTITTFDPSKTGNYRAQRAAATSIRVVCKPEPSGGPACGDESRASEAQALDEKQTARFLYTQTIFTQLTKP